MRPLADDVLRAYRQFIFPEPTVNTAASVFSGSSNNDGSASTTPVTGSFLPGSPVIAYSPTTEYTPPTSILHGAFPATECTSPELATPDAVRGFPPSASGAFGGGAAAFQVPHAAAPLGGEYWVAEYYAYLHAEGDKAVPSSSSLDGAV